jgi:acyl dehydratase
LFVLVESNKTIKVVKSFAAIIGMIMSVKAEITLNFLKGFLNAKKGVKNELIESPKTIHQHSKLKFNQSLLQKYHDMVEWKKDGIHPLFPYALLTHLHFRMVNDKRFPFSPFGLIHKSEKITCLSPLTSGQWEMDCTISEYREVEKGYEMDVVSKLTIDGKHVWTSVTTAFKRTKTGAPRKKTAPSAIKSEVRWHIPQGHGLKYGMISNNLDFIHISDRTARLFGLKKAIMHGMWTVGRCMSELDLECPFELNVNFLRPITMPSDVLFHQEKSQEQTEFGVYTKMGNKAYLSGDFRKL